mgnify:CR=1 FL=1
MVPIYLSRSDAPDHIERFKHVVRAYEPLSITIKVAIFGLTLDAKPENGFALYWTNLQMTLWALNRTS